MRGRALQGLGVDVHRGDLEDLDALRRGAERADGVVHAACIHDFTQFARNCEIDRIAIGAIGDSLAGSGKPLVVPAGIPGEACRACTEDDPPNNATPRLSEQVGLAQAARSLRAMAVRLPQAHNRDKAGLVSYPIAVARHKGDSAWVWTARQQREYVTTCARGRVSHKP